MLATLARARQIAFSEPRIPISLSQARYSFIRASCALCCVSCSASGRLPRATVFFTRPSHVDFAAFRSSVSLRQPLASFDALNQATLISAACVDRSLISSRSNTTALFPANTSRFASCCSSTAAPHRRSCSIRARVARGSRRLSHQYRHRSRSRRAALMALHFTAATMAASP